MDPRPLVDVAIVGYGPTGLAMAALLARRGHSVRVFERWPTLYGAPRMATIDGESARILQAACDIDQALRNSRPRSRYLFANEAGRILIDHPWDGKDRSGFPLRISLHQPDVEDALDLAARHHGAVVHQGWEAVAIVQHDGEVAVTAQARGPATRPDQITVRARYLVGADGARSTVRSLLGIEQEAWPFRAAWYSVDTRRLRVLPNLRGVSPDAQDAVIFCVPGGRAHSVIPLGRDHIRFNFQVDPDADPAPLLHAEAAWRHLQDVYGLQAGDVAVTRQAVYPFEGRLARRWRAGRVFLAGDAAHVMTPFLGQGGCSALRDAIHLAWKLDLVLRGVADDTLLDTYEIERVPHVRACIEGSDRLAALAFMSEAAVAAARDRQLLAGQLPPAAALPMMARGLLAEEAVGDDDHPPAPIGDIAPQSVVEHVGSRGRLDAFTGWGFQLIALDADPTADLAPQQRAFLADLRCTIVFLDPQASRDGWRDIDGACTRFLRDHGATAMLVRPDFVVFGVAHAPAGIAGLVDRLAARLGR